jgi:hypothetical protein
VMWMKCSFLWVVTLHHWLMGEMSKDILTLEDETTTLSQNRGCELPSYLVPHHRKKETSSDHSVTVKTVR